MKVGSHFSNLLGAPALGAWPCPGRGTSPARPPRSHSFAAAVALAVAMAPVTAESPTRTLKVATLAPRGSVWFKELAQVASDWKRGSKGRAEMIVYWGGTQGDEETVVRRINLGQLQGAWLTTTGLTRVDPGFNALNMPLFYDSTDELFCVIDRLMPVLGERAEARGFVVVSPGYAGWVQMFTTRPVRTLDELKRLKIWTSVGDERMVHWYKGNGFHPVALASTDLTASLMQGLVEGVPTTPLAALSLQYYRRTPHVLELDLAPLPGALVVSVEAWRRLPRDLQSGLTATAAASWSRMQVSVPDADRRAVDAMRQYKDFTITRLKGTPAAAAFDEQARGYATAMRGTWVPADIYDLTVSHREVCRKQKRCDTTQTVP